MPLPRKGSPRRGNRRTKSRSRSYSPKSSRRRSRSHSRERRRSRSPREKKKHSEKHRSRSRERRRSKSYEERRRSRSKTPPKHRAARRSPSEERSYPVKRQADSSVKRQTYRSRSPSPAPVKKSKESYRYKSESPELRRKSSKHRSPSPPRGRFIVEPSSTSSSRKHSDSKPRKDEIDYVKIIDLSPKQKLNKRFQTPEQKLQGPFDFEENITIGIHRGPQHLDLDDDVPVNYDFNPKTFIMLHPKKEYRRPIFERDEILAFKHDAILDEEAYVEKRTITVKPTDKKSSKYRDQSDYKITVGSDRDGDRRRVQDSGSRSRMSRKSSYDQDVTVRLDPKPDPRYERMYREQKRHDDDNLMDDRIKRNPNDLRYNLMRRSDRDSDRDRDRDRGRDRDHSGDRGMVDARSKIQARRQDSSTMLRTDRRTSESPPRTIDKDKRFQLPDFKNRPAKYLDRLGKPVDDEVPSELQKQWGYCEICMIPINSESQAFSHINGSQHRSNEAKKFGGFYANDEPSTSASHQVTFPQKRFSRGNDDDDDFDSDDAEPVEPHSKRSKRADDGSDAGNTDSKRDWAKVKPDRPGLNASLHNKPRSHDDPDWSENPTYIPKGGEYYSHDDRNRDDMNFWERKQMFLKTGRYPGRSRGRGFRGAPSWRGPNVPRGRGFVPFRARGRGRGVYSTFNQSEKQRNSDVWKHDKFVDEDDGEEKSEKKDRKKEHQDKHKEKNGEKRKSDKPVATVTYSEEERIEREEKAIMQDVRVELT